MTEYTHDQFKADHFDLLSEACQLLTQGIYLDGYAPHVGKPDYDRALKLMQDAGVVAPNEQQKRFDAVDNRLILNDSSRRQNEGR